MGIPGRIRPTVTNLATGRRNVSSRVLSVNRHPRDSLKRVFPRDLRVGTGLRYGACFESAPVFEKCSRYCFEDLMPHYQMVLNYISQDRHVPGHDHKTIKFNWKPKLTAEVCTRLGHVSYLCVTIRFGKPPAMQERHVSEVHSHCGLPGSPSQSLRSNRATTILCRTEIVRFREDYHATSRFVHTLLR